MKTTETLIDPNPPLQLQPLEISAPAACCVVSDDEASCIGWFADDAPAVWQWH